MLALALSCFTYAGDMPFDYTNPPPAPSDGIIHTGTPEASDNTAQADEADGWIGTGLAETVLDALGSVLALV
jgi:hypothetical protein